MYSHQQQDCPAEGTASEHPGLTCTSITNILTHKQSQHVTELAKSLQSLLFWEKWWHGSGISWIICNHLQLTRTYAVDSCPAGDGGGGHWLVRMQWRLAGWSVCLPLLIFLCSIKSRSSLLAPAHPSGPRKRAIKWLWWWCTSLQTDNHASISYLNLLQAGCSSWRPTNAAKALKVIYTFISADTTAHRPQCMYSLVCNYVCKTLHRFQSMKNMQSTGWRLKNSWNKMKYGKFTLFRPF